jgi:hypothetical protein
MSKFDFISLCQATVVLFSNFEADMAQNGSKKLKTHSQTF